MAVDKITEGRTDLEDSVQKEDKSTNHERSKWTCLRSISLVKHSWFVEETILLVKLALPVILTLVTQQMVFALTLVYMGHTSVSTTELDATGLGISFVNLTGLSFVYGLASAADTFCSQSYGYKNYKRVGVVLQRGILIIGLSCLPIAVLWLNCEPLLLLLRQKPCIVRLTVQYVKTSVFALPLFVVFTMLERYLQAQSIVWTSAFVNLLLLAISAALQPLFIYEAHLGIVGASISIILAYFISTVFLIVYIWLRGLHKKTWGGWSWQSLDKWGEFLKLGIPGLLILSSGWWAFEISYIVIGTIDETQLGVHSILTALENNSYMIPFGFGTATCIRVGNELGAGNPQRASRVADTAIILGGCLSLLTIVFFLATRKVLPRLFTANEDVLIDMDMAIYGLIMVASLDSLLSMGSGILRGSGRQIDAAIVSAFSYYLIGLPTGISLALLTDLGTFGMWIGLGVANGLQALLYAVFVLSTNWKKQSERAMKIASEGAEAASHIENDQIECKATEERDTAPKDILSDADELIPNGDSTPLMSHQETEKQGGKQTTSEKYQSDEEKVSRKLVIKLLLVKGSLFISGLVILVIGIILAFVVFHQDTTKLDKLCNNVSCNSLACNNSGIIT